MASGPGLPNGDLVTAWGLLTEATVAVSTHLARGLERRAGLTLPEFDVLIRLYRSADRRNELVRVAQELGLTRAGFSKLVNRLEWRGLVATSALTGSRDGISIALTSAGWQVVETALDDHVDDLRRHLVDPLGIEGVRMLSDLARILRDSNAAIGDRS